MKKCAALLLLAHLGCAAPKEIVKTTPYVNLDPGRPVPELTGELVIHYKKLIEKDAEELVQYLEEIIIATDSDSLSYEIIFEEPESSFIVNYKSGSFCEYDFESGVSGNVFIGRNSLEFEYYPDYTIEEPPILYPNYDFADFYPHGSLDYFTFRGGVWGHPRITDDWTYDVHITEVQNFYGYSLQILLNELRKHKRAGKSWETVPSYFEIYKNEELFEKSEKLMEQLKTEQGEIPKRDGYRLCPI